MHIHTEVSDSSGKERGQMSAICQLESPLMTFTWPVTESCRVKTTDRIGPEMEDHVHRDGLCLLLPG